MIETKGLSKSYGRVTALADLTFAARPGRVTGLLGHNGAGKTTCLRILTGYTAPSAGAARVAGHDVLADPLAARAAIGYLPESAPCYPEMRARDYLRHRAALAGLPRARRAPAADLAAERCRLEGAARRRIAHLSKGFRQRVALAAAILHDPPVLILDEPASGLDPAQIVETRHLVRDLARDKTVLLSSHILAEIEAACDDVVVLARGSLRAAGPLEEVARAHAGPTELVAELRATPDAASAIAASIADPERATVAPLGDPSGDWTRLTLTLAPSDTQGSDPRETLAAAARDRGIPLRELTLVRPPLERVLLDLLQPPPEEATR